MASGHSTSFLYYLGPVCKWLFTLTQGFGVSEFLVISARDFPLVYRYR